MTTRKSTKKPARKKSPSNTTIKQSDVVIAMNNMKDLIIDERARNRDKIIQIMPPMTYGGEDVINGVSQIRYYKDNKCTRVVVEAWGLRNDGEVVALVRDGSYLIPATEFTNELGEIKVSDNSPTNTNIDQAPSGIAVSSDVLSAAFTHVYRDPNEGKWRLYGNDSKNAAIIEIGHALFESGVIAICENELNRKLNKDEISNRTVQFVGADEMPHFCGMWWKQDVSASDVAYSPSPTKPSDAPTT